VWLDEGYIDTKKAHAQVLINLPSLLNWGIGDSFLKPANINWLSEALLSAAKS